MRQADTDSFSSVRSSGCQKDLIEGDKVKHLTVFHLLRANPEKAPGLICLPQSPGLTAHSCLLETQRNELQLKAKMGVFTSGSWGPTSRKWEL